MSHEPIWKLRSLQTLLEQRLRDEEKKRVPNSFTIQALKRRTVQVRTAISHAR